jgi:hypothetical protein
MLLSFALAAAATEPTYQAAQPSPIADALNAPRPLLTQYPELTGAPAPVRAGETLLPGQLHPFGPAPRATQFSGPFACADQKCRTRTPVYNAQTVDQREPDGRDHY